MYCILPSMYRICLRCTAAVHRRLWFPPHIGMVCKNNSIRRVGEHEQFWRDSDSTESAFAKPLSTCEAFKLFSYHKGERRATRASSAGSYNDQRVPSQGRKATYTDAIVLPPLNSYLLLRPPLPDPHHTAIPIGPSVMSATCMPSASPSEQSQQRRPHLPFNPIWGDTCGPLSGNTILGVPYPDGRYVLRDIGRRNYHGRRDVRVYVAGLHTTQMGPLAVKKRTELLRMAKLSRVDWRSTTEPGRSPSKTESSTPRDQELNDSSRNKAKRIRIVLNTTQHRVNAKTCGSATVLPTRL